MKLTVMRRYFNDVAVFHDGGVGGDPDSHRQHAFGFFLAKKRQDLRDFVCMFFKQLAQRGRLLHFPLQLPLARG